MVKLLHRHMRARHGSIMHKVRRRTPMPNQFTNKLPRFSNHPYWAINRLC